MCIEGIEKKKAAQVTEELEVYTLHRVVPQHTNHCET